MGTVRGAVLHAPHQEFVVEEMTLKEPTDWEVQVRVMASGLCHSDYHVVSGDQFNTLPMVAGHEGAGVVEAVGSSVTRVKPGDHIATAYIPSCGVCRFCAQGMQYICNNGAGMQHGMMLDGTPRFVLSDGRGIGAMQRLGTYANYLVTHETQCIKIPDDIPFELACLVACGVTTGWGAAVNAAAVRPRDSVLIMGAGGVGMNAVQGAAAAGAAHVVVAEPVEMRRETALRLGATAAFPSVAEAMPFIHSISDGQGVDSAVVTVGRVDGVLIGEAFSAVRKAGTCAVVSAGEGAKGIDISPFELVVMAKRLQGVLFGNSNPVVDIPRLLDYYRSGHLKLAELITRKYSVEEINQGYQDMFEGRTVRGVVVHEH